MKIAAIIAEYNPFHNGHAYHISKTKEMTGADHVLVLMSGDFVQRGTPAICNKYIRTQMALQEGASAVLELPSLYALSSAEYFAGGAVSILNQLGSIDTLSFGSESGDISALLSCSSDLSKLSENDSKDILSLLNEGYSYPLARQKVLLEQNCDSIHQKFRDSLLSSPNNILGLEYCKLLSATHSSIKPFTIKRKGSAYNDEKLSKEDMLFSSASAIRKSIQTEYDSIVKHVPSSVYQLLVEHQVFTNFICANDFSSILHYKLLSEQQIGFSKYLDCNEDLSDRICKYIPDFIDFESFCQLIKTKNITYSRVCRVFMHIILNITKPDFYADSLLNRIFSTPYVRLLGFRQDAGELLSKLKKDTSIPIISKPAHAPKLLKPLDYQMFQQDIFCSDLYQSIYWQKKFSTDSSIRNQWKKSSLKSDIQCSPIIY